MTPASRTAAWVLVLASMAAALFVLSLAPSREIDPGGGSGPIARDALEESADPGREEDPLEPLRGLGYIAWDEGADPSRQGVTRHDPLRAAPGYNLHGDGDLQFHLMSLEGVNVHTWTVPETSGACVHGELLPGGRLLAVCFGRTLFLVDRDSNLIWELAVRAHHDPAVLSGGSILIPYNELVDHAGRRTLFDGIGHISPGGDFRKLWFSHDHRDELKAIHGEQPLDIPPAAGAAERPELGFDYYHINSVELLPRTKLGQKDPRFREGNILVCFRNTSLIAVLDQDDMSLVWHWGPGQVELPHSPSMLPDGRILLFDNGYHRGYSRVLEIDPVTGETLWSYQGDPPESFFSKEQGAVQRLGNGNTLITESDRGRVLEVTRRGEIVWEYWSPVVAGGKRKRIYRMTRLTPDQAGKLVENSS